MNENNKEHIYMCIDLKSFYASVECRERGLDPMTTNLVVADPTRTEKTICLAVSPAMKACLDETSRRREIQMAYNKEHGIIPKTIIKDIVNTLKITNKSVSKEQEDKIVNTIIKLYDKKEGEKNKEV